MANKYMNDDIFFNLLKPKINAVYRGSLIELDIKKHRVYDLYYGGKKLTLICDDITILEVSKNTISLNDTKYNKKISRLQNKLKALLTIDKLWDDKQLSLV